MARTKKLSLYVASEGSNFAGDPSGSGANYVPVPALEIGLINDGKSAIETNYMTGRNHDTAAIPGPDGGTFDFTIPWYGFSAAGAAGSAPPSTLDALDILIAHLLGTTVTRNGGDITSGTTPAALVVASDLYTAGDLVPIWEAGLPSSGNGGPRTQWHQIISDAGTGTYGVAPNLIQNITTAAVGYATRQWSPDDDGGPSVAFVYIEDGRQFTLLGCRCKATVSVAGAANATVQMKVSVEYDQLAETSKASLPAPLAAPAVTPLVASLSPIWFNGAAIPTPKWSIDLGLTSAVVASTETITGRANNELIKTSPTLTISPQVASTYEALKRDQTVGQLLMQIGGGRLSGGVLNTMCVCWDAAQARDAKRVDEAGRIRNEIMFKLADPVVVGATSVAARPFTIARA
jgi:hypothetical protein